MLRRERLGEDGVNEGSGSSPKVKVVDRRWFTEDGSLRDERAPVPEEARPAPEEARSAPEEARPAPEEARPVPEERNRIPEPGGQPAETPVAAQDSAPSSQQFVELIAMLAQHAELYLAGGQGLAPQPDQGRRLIDFLVILETKTRGNLSAEEAQVLSNVIFQLRTLYLQRGP
jgi:hypothetical protein